MLKWVSLLKNHLLNMNMMVIEGVQSIMSDEEKMMGQDELAARDGARGDIKMKGMLKSSYKHFVRFDTGKNYTRAKVELK